VAVDRDAAALHGGAVLHNLGAARAAAAAQGRGCVLVAFRAANKHTQARLVRRCRCSRAPDVHTPVFIS
jgi:hypothetical protein